MDIRIIRSKRRRKTVEARETDGTLEIRAPARMSDEELQPIISRLAQRIENHKRKSRLNDEELERRAQRLNRQFFDDELRWTSIRWVGNQAKRHGSCTPGRGTIRISHRLAQMPRFVLDYVIIHELAHLIKPNHGRDFWELVYRYPKTERARGFLMAVGMEDIE
jgi:predicted metal-dependent hydrolase